MSLTFIVFRMVYESHIGVFVSTLYPVTNNGWYNVLASIDVIIFGIPYGKMWDVSGEVISEDMYIKLATSYIYSKLKG